MQSEIDHFLTEQNNLLIQQNSLLAEQNKVLNQQVDSLKTILTGYSEVEQELQGKISILQAEKTGTTRLDLGTKRRGIQNRTGQFFAGFTAELSTQLNEPITNAINTSLKPSELKQYCEQYGEHRTQTYSTENYNSTDRSRASSLEALATQSINQYRRRLEDSGQAARAVRNNAWQLNIIDQKFEQLAELVKNIRIKPQLASAFKLRYDGYYPDYNIYHERLSKQQDELYRSKNQLGIIDCIAEKADNLKQYTSRASNSLSSYDYEKKLKKSIKNDEIMLKYLNCEIVLEPQNDRFKSQRQTYQNCLDSFEYIKIFIAEKKSPYR